MKDQFKLLSTLQAMSLYMKKKKTYLQSHGIEARIPGIKKGQKMLLVLHDTIE